MSSLEAIQEKQISLELTFAQKFAELDKALQSASPQPHNTIKGLSEDIKRFKDCVTSTLSLLRLQIEAVSDTVDSIEMRHRRKYLLFGGVPEADNEDIVDTVVAVCQNKLLLPEVTCSSITVCHRLGKKSEHVRPVLVRFADSKIKNSVWDKKTALKGSPVVLSEFLTRQRKSLFIAARKHFGMRSVWTLDGNIYVKLDSGKRERVTTSEQLLALISRHNLSVQSSTGSAGPSTLDSVPLTTAEACVLAAAPPPAPPTAGALLPAPPTAAALPPAPPTPAALPPAPTTASAAPKAAVSSKHKQVGERRNRRT